MATSAATVEHILDTLAPLPISACKMFGEYALYLDGRVVALICNDDLFIKPTSGVLVLLANGPMGPPYPGAKPHFVATELLDDVAALTAALRAVAADVPLPKPKKPKVKT